MSAGPRQLGHEGPSLVNPAPDTPVFPVDRARPGTREDGIARFCGLRW
jgi:hypothetical protein